jgi:hypothetical protein
MIVDKRELVLKKGQERFVFRYDNGSEAELLDALVSAATDGRTSFDWFDAAVLSFKLSQTLMSQADQILYQDLQDPLGSL